MPNNPIPTAGSPPFPDYAETSPRVRVAPGVELAYVDRGAGQPIIFIPHWTFTKEVFEHQVATLSANYRVISYDPRSQGESTFAVEGNDYISHAYDLAALLEALDVHNPILAGWGTGALTAWNFISHHGAASVAANITIDMPPKPLSTTPDAWSEGSVEGLSAVHTLFLRDARGHTNYMRRCIETEMVQRDLTQAELDRLLALSLKTNPLVTAQLFASGMFADLTNAAIAAARQRPTLFFIAQNASHSAVSFITHLLPESKYVAFGGRMMFWEHHSAFNHVLTEFIHNRVETQCAPSPAASVYAHR
jgi:pimeloyl-ACP methyl ester carboxylesterase